MEIRSVGSAVRHDIFTVVGTDIPPDAVLEFNTAVEVVRVQPEFVRPHLAVVESLPDSIPVGDIALRLTSLSTATESNVVPVTVVAGPPPSARLLYAGEDKLHPYTIAFVANPLLATRAPTALNPAHLVFRADPILADRLGFQRGVVSCLKGLFAGEEDILQRDGIDSRIRLVSVFGAPLPLGAPESLLAANSLIIELPERAVDIRRNILSSFLARFTTEAGAVEADIVVIINGSATHTQSKGRPTDDSLTLGGTDVEYDLDDLVLRHRPFARIPGSVSLDVAMDPESPTIIHEFCHAASEVNNGWIVDVDFDPRPTNAKFTINLKYRDAPGGVVPTNFATYNGTIFKSNPSRFEGTPYPAGWSAFHPLAFDDHQHNLMDHWLDHGRRLHCRLDHLTRTWLRDRLDVKLSR